MAVKQVLGLCLGAAEAIDFTKDWLDHKKFQKHYACKLLSSNHVVLGIVSS